MGGHAQQGSDKGAAFMGLIGGAVLIGAILYAIVIWTNGIGVPRWLGWSDGREGG